MAGCKSHLGQSLNGGHPQDCSRPVSNRRLMDPAGESIAVANLHNATPTMAHDIPIWPSATTKPPQAKAYKALIS
jgi:hypothetical protein